MNTVVKIPTLVGILFLIVGVAAGIILLQNTQIFRSGASGQTAPQNVRATNITDSSFTVSWTTQIPTTGFVAYGTSQSSINQTAQSESEEKSTTHFVSIENLNSQTNYYFEINSNGERYDSQGAPWTATTGRIIGEPEGSLILSGGIEVANGVVAEDALVYATISGATTLSAKTSKNGSWLINLALIRNTSLNSYASIDVKTSVVEIFVQTTDSTASAKITPEAGRNTPTITMGQVYNFTDVVTGGSEIPGALTNLPENVASHSSKFNVEESSAPANITETVTLESIEDGEVITTDEPEFFGEGPVGTTLTITIESDPTTETVVVGTDGAWKWNVPEDLESGEHKITVSWRDALGILRTFTRSFVVSAAEGPAFESTPSNTLSPSPTATTTPTASPTLIATSSPSPTATTSTVPIPDSGTLTPTFALLIMSIGLMLLSASIAFFVF